LKPPPAAHLDPSLLVIAAGVAAALHVGKLPPAIGALREALGLTLVEAGFLLSLVQLAGAALGLAFGALADGLGLKRSIVGGLALLAAASAAGGFARDAASLMLLRAAEGLGFLLVALPAPALLRRLVAPERLARRMGVWGAYMPLATALALLAGPPWIATLGWASWWWLLAGISALAALAVGRLVRADPGPRPGASAAASPLRARLALTLSTPGPWAVALAFAMYSAQWLAVIGFLPALAAQAGLGALATGLLAALVAAVNIVGNVGAGRLLHRGVPAPALLATGFSAMALATLAAFAGAGDGGLPLAARYGALLAFSALGGLIPATLFSLAVRVAPGESTVATTVGWMQQWSSLGQLGGPPLVAAVASLAGGWHLTWTATGALSLAGLALAAWLGRLAAAPAPPGRPG
jgi:MFS family permease